MVIKTVYSILGSAKEWRVDWLQLPENIGAESWEALRKVASKGKMETVRVSKSALGAANEQQVEALWQATDWRWWNYDGDGMIAHKGDGDAGLQKLLPFDQNCNSNASDDDLENWGKCCQIL